MTAVLIPDSEAGTTTRTMVCSCVAPNATDASRRAPGTLWMASLGDAANGRDGHKRQHQRGIEHIQPRGNIEDFLQKGRHQHHPEEADDHRRQRRQKLHDGLDDFPHPVAGNFGKIDGRHDPQRDGDHAGQAGDHQ